MMVNIVKRGGRAPPNPHQPEVEFLDEILTIVFLLAIQLCIEISISSKSRTSDVFLQTHATTYIFLQFSY
jgi:hypothetical protein